MSIPAGLLGVALLVAPVAAQQMDLELNPTGLGQDFAVPSPPSTYAVGVQLFTNQADFLAATGAINCEDFESWPTTGDCTSGVQSVIDFGPFRVEGASDEGGAVKILDAPCTGNHNTTPGGIKYLSGDTDVAFRNAQIDFEFDDATCAWGAYIIDAEQGIEITINGNVYLVPPTGDGGEAFFGIIDTGMFVTVELRVAVGSDSHYSIDDVCYGCPECFLVVGNAPGSGSFYPGIHEFHTQVGTVQGWYGTLMEVLPTFPLPQQSLVGSALAHGTKARKQFSELPTWMQDGEFVVQVAMWNPTVFPGHPEQFSNTLWVKVLANGSVLSQSIQPGTGMQVWAEKSVDAHGKPVVRFPFTIPGL